MYFNLAYKNLKGNIKNYFIYLMSLITSIVLFYTLNSIKHNTSVVELRSIKEFVEIGFTFAGVLIAVFLAIFIFFTNTFFIRKRKKEIGMYIMFGMSQKKVALMLMIENILLGLFTLVIGILLGALLSKGFLQLLLTLFGEYNVSIKFEIPPQAVITTFLTFSGFFLFSAITNYFFILRYKLIDLFKGDSQKEGKVGKVSFWTILLGLISIILLCIGYYIAHQLEMRSNLDQFYLELGSSFAGVILGTYGFFIFAIRLLSSLVRKSKKYYYKGLNTFSNRQISHRIYTNGKILGTITLLIATTIGAFSTTFSYYFQKDSFVNMGNPYAYEFYTMSNKEASQGIEPITEEQVNDLVAIIDSYKDKYPITFNAQTQYIMENVYLPNDSIEKRAAIVSESQMNKLLTYKKRPEVILNADNDIYLIYNRTLDIKQLEIRETLYQVVDDNYLLPHNTGAYNGCDLVIIVKDNVYESLYGQAENILAIHSVNIKNAKRAKPLHEELENYSRTNNLNPWFTDSNSLYSSYKSMLYFTAAFLFMGLFVGLVFLVSTGSMISIKLLSTTSEDKNRYNILRKIGVNEKEIFKSICKQIAFMFFVPVCLASVHLLFSLGFVARMLEFNILVPVFYSVCVFFIIYSIYFITTTRTYYYSTK